MSDVAVLVACLCSAFLAMSIQRYLYGKYQKPIQPPAKPPVQQNDTYDYVSRRAKFLAEENAELRVKNAHLTVALDTAMDFVTSMTKEIIELRQKRLWQREAS